MNGSGRIRLTFAGANFVPGSTLSGCGPLIGGCTGRLRVFLDLLPQSSGPVLSVYVYMHAPSIACLWGRTSQFSVTEGVPVRVEVLLDQADSCRTPLTVTSMDAVVNGTVETASRQEWRIHYEFQP